MKVYFKKCIFISILLLATTYLFSQEKMYVTVKDAPVNEKASASSGLVAKLEYGTQVNVSQHKNKWCRIETDDGINGWVSEKSLSSKKVASKKVSADAKEIALAGKGWSSPLEEAYSEASGFNFELIDQLENDSFQQEEIIEFIVEGKLNLGGLK